MSNTNPDEDSGLIEIVIPVKLAQYLASGELNVDSFCRICMNEGLEMTSIINENELHHIADMFTLFTSIQIYSNDGIPPRICITCKEQVINCFEFKQQCEKADVIWKTCLKGEFITKIEQPLKTNTDLESQHDYEDETNCHQNSSVLNMIKEESDTYREDEDYCIKTETTKRIKDTKCMDYIDNINDELIKEERLDEDFSDLYCGVCSQSFIDPAALLVHLKSHEKSQHVCTLCSKKFSNHYSLKHHKEKKHKFRGEHRRGVQCKCCKEAFASEGDLHIHSSLHTGNGKKCNSCHKEFHLKQQLKRHLRRHMEEKKYKCDVCYKPFTELYAMVRHRRVHTGEVVEKKHTCNICNKRFADNAALREHKGRHTGEKPCVCVHCGSAFPSARLLRSHLRVHDDTKPHQCRYCDKRFRHESTRNTHHRTHTGEKPFICSVCGKTFIQNSNLSLHMRTHSGEKPYACSTCGRRFTALSTMKAHERTHSREKPYECPVCRKRFARMNLSVHMRQHTGERPHACAVCHKQFATAARLRDHSRVHTGEKPFECNICNQKISSKSHLLKHIKGHNEKGKSFDNKSKVTNPKTVHRAEETLNDNQMNNDIKMTKTECNGDNIVSFTMDDIMSQEVTVEFVPDVNGELELQQHDEDSKAEVAFLEEDQNVIEVYSDNHEPYT